MSQGKGFRFIEALAKDMRQHCPLGTGHHGFPLRYVGDLQHFHMDPPVGWLTGSGPSGLNEDQVADGKTLGLVPPVGVELHLGPSS